MKGGVTVTGPLLSKAIFSLELLDQLSQVWLVGIRAGQLNASRDFRTSIVVRNEGSTSGKRARSSSMAWQLVAIFKESAMGVADLKMQ